MPLQWLLMQPAVLMRSRIFDGLTDDERERWLSRATSATLERGHTLARQGEPARHFYLLETGFLKVLQLTAEGAELIIRFIAPGDPFGGVVALGDAVYPVTAIVVQPSVDARLDAPGRSRAARSESAGPGQHHARDGLHMTDALTRVRELTTARVGQRLAHTLVRLARQCGRAEGGGVLVTQPFTRQELADLAGTTLYTASRTLAKWESLGLVESRKRLLLLRSLKKLEEVAGADED